RRRDRRRRRRRFRRRGRRRGRRGGRRWDRHREARPTRLAVLLAAHVASARVLGVVADQGAGRRTDGHAPGEVELTGQDGVVGKVELGVVDDGVKALDGGCRSWRRDDLAVARGVDQGEYGGDVGVARVEDDDAVADVEAGALARRVVEDEEVDGAAGVERVGPDLDDALTLVELLLGDIVLAARRRGDAL